MKSEIAKGYTIERAITLVIYILFFVYNFYSIAILLIYKKKSAKEVFNLNSIRPTCRIFSLLAALLFVFANIDLNSVFGLFNPNTALFLFSLGLNFVIATFMSISIITLKIHYQLKYTPLTKKQTICIFCTIPAFFSVSVLIHFLMMSYSRFIMLIFYEAISILCVSILTLCFIYVKDMYRLYNKFETPSMIEMDYRRFVMFIVLIVISIFSFTLYLMLFVIETILLNKLKNVNFKRNPVVYRNWTTIGYNMVNFINLGIFSMFSKGG